LPIVNVVGVGCKCLVSFPTGSDHGRLGHEAPGAQPVVEDAELGGAAAEALDGHVLVGGGTHLPVVLGGEGLASVGARGEQESSYAESSN
jgi:hypothetical protein